MEKYSKKLIIFIFTLIFLVIGLGTYIYVCDEGLREYLKKYIESKKAVF